MATGTLIGRNRGGGPAAVTRSRTTSCRRATACRRRVLVTTATLILLPLIACGGPAPTPTLPATVQPSATTLPAATATGTTMPIAIAPTATITSPPTATIPAPTAIVPVPTSTGAPPAATGTPAAILYAAAFATWFTGIETDPLPFRASYDPASGEYRLALTDPARGYIYYRYAPEGRGFADFRLDVEARRVAGPTNGGSYGVVFRARPSTSGDRAVAQYNFYVTADGTFALILLPPTGPATTVVPRTPSPAIGTGEATNRLTVICRGDTITLAINDQTVGTFEATLQGMGAVGLYVANPANPVGAVGMEAAFRNLRVTALPSAGGRERAPGAARRGSR